MAAFPQILSWSAIDKAYAEGGLTNVTNLMFAEEQIGFLAAGMSKSGFVCSISSLRIPAKRRRGPGLLP
jgi:hypothetical protein